MSRFWRMPARCAGVIGKCVLTEALRLFLFAAFLIGAATAAQAQVNSTTTVTADPSLPTLGQPVTLTATVSAPGGNVTNAYLGVTFFDGAVELSTVPVTGGPETGTATLTWTPSTAGERTITASFSGSPGAGASFDELQLNVLPGASTTTVTSSPNPSALGQDVTITATVTSAVGDVTTGLGVTFFDGAVELSTVPVTGGPTSGTATLTVPLSTAGSRAITAAFNGTSTVGASFAEVIHTVGEQTEDSLNLRAMQIVASREAALASGRAFSGAVESAISDGLDGLGQGATMSASSLRFAYGPEPSATDAGWPNGGAGQGGDWQVWADLRTSGAGDWSADSGDEDLSGLQFNALLGVSHRIGDNLLVGVLGGYESFDYKSDTLDADLDGDGWTIGGYVGGRIAEGLRFHAAAGYSGIGYDGSSGAADGSFDASRWIVTGGLAGDVEVSTFVVEPSLSAFGVWEDQDSYVDSLGIFQDERDFSTGRISAGAKILYPLETGSGLKLQPYAGLYADYTFEDDSDELAAIGLAGGELQDLLSGGLSARLTGGVSAKLEGDGKVTLGGEMGGLGDDIQFWNFKAGFNLLF